MIDLRKVCMRMSENCLVFEAAGENGSVPSRYPIRLKIENLAELVAGRSETKIWTKKINLWWRKSISNSVEFWFSIVDF